MKYSAIKRILVIGDYFPDSFADNIIITLKNMGHEVCWAPANPFANTDKAYSRIIASYALKIFPKLESVMSAKLIDTATHFNPDLVISTQSGVAPETIAKMKNKTGAIIVCWYTDSVANLVRQYILAAPYDALFCKDMYMVELFRKKLNKNTFYLPEACNPLWHNTTTLNEDEEKYYGCDISVAGNMYYYRAMILEELMEHELKIWGPMFPRWLNSETRKAFQGRYIAKHEKAKAFIGAKINLNTVHYTEVSGLNCRAFEIAGCGGFQIVDYKSALNELFEIGKEIVTFDTIGELKDKVAYYLEHDNERREIAGKGYLRAHKDHTYEKRLVTVLEVVSNLSKKGLCGTESQQVAKHG